MYTYYSGFEMREWKNFENFQVIDAATSGYEELANWRKRVIAM